MLTADGCQDVANIDDPSCCMPPLCGNDLCCTFVEFMQLLPSGPLWDYWKNAAISYFQSHDDPAECPLVSDPACPSLVLHAIYCVLKLKDLVHNALWVAVRESSPYTAITTLDDYLARLQWEDCYNQHCRSVLLGELTPYEIWTECGPLFCPVDFPPELIAAVKKNVAIALTRANMGIIKNMCSINWIIEPLGAEIVPIYPVPSPGPPPAEPCNMCMTDDIKFEIHTTRDWLSGVGSGDVCDPKQPHVPAWWDWGCDKPAGLPDTIWPGLLAAECIVRSMLPVTCPPIIVRAC
jgi:hypothetical protein